MSREVDSSCKLWLLIAAGGLEKLAWTSWKKNKLHSTKGTTGKSLFVGHGHFVSTAKFCINVDSVKYSDKTKSWNFWTSSWIRSDKSLLIFRGDHSILNHYFSLAGWREWNLWLKMIDTLIICFWRFRWISEVSRKVLILAESALQHSEVLKVLW